MSRNELAATPAHSATAEMAGRPPPPEPPRVEGAAPPECRGQDAPRAGPGGGPGGMDGGERRDAAQGAEIGPIIFSLNASDARSRHS
jgi:hypothetical protein